MRSKKTTAQKAERKEANNELRKSCKRNTIVVGRDGNHRDGQTGKFIGNGFNHAVRAMTGRAPIADEDADTTN